jgi:Predicted endonuclease containing a URI domain
MYYVYSLKCKNGFYTGYCENINERLKRYENGHAPATADRLPMGLEFYFAIPNKYKAFEFEKYLKSGSGRAFIKKHLAWPKIRFGAIFYKKSATRIFWYSAIRRSTRLSDSISWLPCVWCAFCKCCKTLTIPACLPSF